MFCHELASKAEFWASQTAAPWNRLLPDRVWTWNCPLPRPISASTGASIKDIKHDRLFAGPDVSAVRVVCTVEIAGREHRDGLLAALREAGVRLERDS